MADNIQLTSICESETVLKNPHVTILVPNIVNDIYITLPAIMEKHIIQVRHHGTPFKILHDYLYPLKGTNILVVPIVTPQRMLLQTDDIIATVYPVLIPDVLVDLKGNTKVKTFSLNKLYFSIFLFLF